MCIRDRGLTDSELAVCCASHSGAQVHLDNVRSLLRKGGLDESLLRCGAHWPADGAMADSLRAAGEEPSSIHNNCSGKHAGMLVRCVHQGYPTEDYLNPEHAVQRRMIEDAASICGVRPRDFTIGIDGCTAPTWGLRLSAEALGLSLIHI